MRTKVTVERQALRFAAAHMATFRGQVEPLHGHNYAVVVECEGPLAQDGWVVDFGYLKRIMKRLCDELDHKFLLQRSSGLLSASERDDAWEIVAGGRRYVFPKSDVLALPITNSTAEQLAGWLHERLCAELLALGVTTVETVTIGVEEAPGQTGWYTHAFPGAAARDTLEMAHAQPDRARQ
jgi:6-pyruvoyl tetrahydropterin synthase/QueD family protein